MTTTIIANLEKLIGTARDGALLRYSLGNEWLKAGENIKAAECLRAAIERDPHYSAAWKLLGKALTESGALPEALEAYRSGIAVSTTKGDLQAAKEMGVFAKRIARQLGVADSEAEGA